MITWGPLEASPGLLGISWWHITYSKSNYETICKKYMDFYQQFPFEKIFLWSKILKIWKFRWYFLKIRKSENRKIKNVKNLRYENFEIFRFLEKSWSKFLTSKKYIFDRNFWWKSIYFFINRLRIWFWISNVPSRNAEEAGGRLQRPPVADNTVRQAPGKKT